jgi:CHAT domain-containing protein
LKYHRQSLAIRQKINDRFGEGMSWNNLGTSLFKQNQLAEAESSLRSAIQIWESLRSGLNDSNKISLAETQAAAYPVLQEILIRQNRPDAALEVAEQGRARAFAELLARKLDNQAAIAITPPNLNAIRTIAREQNATLVEYSQINAETLYIWVVKPNGDITFRTSRLDAQQPIRRLITRNRGIKLKSANVTAVNPTAPTEKVDHYRSLYDQLIAPIAQDLPTKPDDRVIFLPQGELFLVPFPALKNAQGKFLIEQHTISTAPSIQTLQLTHAKAKHATHSGSALVVGNPTMPLFENEQLMALPGAEAEAIAISQILNTQPLLGNQATKPAVLAQMRRAPIIHLATHGLLTTLKGDIPGAIALAPSAQDNGLLSASELFDLSLSADLAVLSACDTGRGEITGDGVVGLSRSLIAAGVPSVVVSLWAVDDASTSALMSHFYQNLNRSPNKAQALREAMLATMKVYPDPNYWAAFTLIGESDRPAS